jgi:hypothetical protein
MRSYLLAAIPIILSTVLLIGVRVSEPKQPPAYLVGGSEVVRRGENLHTGSGEQKEFVMNETHIFLAENTTLTLLDSAQEPTLAIREGRIVVRGMATITVRDIKVPTVGTTAITFYPWLEKLDVATIGENSMTYSLNTLNTSAPSPLSPFDPKNSSAASFYTWALGSAIK